MKVNLYRCALLVFGLSACGLSAPAIPGQGIRGTVLLGPHCPVVVEGEDCPDTPYETDLVATTPDGTRVIKRFSSDANGIFEVFLPVGEYAIISPQGTQWPYCSSNGAFFVTAGQITELTVYCDTGIR
ncbi:MAG: hypothetical protein ACRDFQ_09640 [Anaerolineales bacterium]